MVHRRFTLNWEALDGHSFQELCADILRREGYDVRNQGIGPDGGVDLLAIQHVTLDAELTKAYTWAVQAKFRTRPTSTVKPQELGNIGNILSRFNADGFLLITNGRVTNKAFLEIRSFSEGPPPTYLTNVWDRAILEGKCLKHQDIRKRYFSSPGDRLHVLVVDDDSLWLAHTTRIVAALGHTVHSANTSAEARSIIDEIGIDVAILDIRLQDSDRPRDPAGGFALAHRMRSVNPDVRIIYNSAYLASADIAPRAQL